VVFHRSIDDHYQIFKIDLENGEVSQLTDEGDNIEPSWSPDGTMIAYGCKSEQNYEICVMDADGANKRQITVSGFDNWGPDWSPDGKSIVYASNEVPYSHLYILDVESNQPRRLLNAEGNEGAPKWSSDGQRIVYMSDRGNKFNIYVVNPDGSNEKQITNFGKDDRPNWAPDSERIVLRREVRSSSVFDGGEVLLIDADGNNEIRLTENQLSENFPAFSPDGKWIVYSTNNQDSKQLAVISVTGGNPAPLILGGVEGDAPDWKP
jgi:TolB protein